MTKFLIITTSFLNILSLQATTDVVGIGARRINVPIPKDFGSSITEEVKDTFEVSSGGTPHIQLLWTCEGVLQGKCWEFHRFPHARGENGVLQMDGSSLNSRFCITFIPSSDKSIMLNGFNFIGDTDGDSYQYRIDVVCVSTGEITTLATTSLWTTDLQQTPQTNGTFAGAPDVNLNGFTGKVGLAYRLEIVRIGGKSGPNDQSDKGYGSNVNIAIDNLSFSEL